MCQSYQGCKEASLVLPCWQWFLAFLTYKSLYALHEKCLCVINLLILTVTSLLTFCLIFLREEFCLYVTFPSAAYPQGSQRLPFDKFSARKERATSRVFNLKRLNLHALSHPVKLPFLICKLVFVVFCFSICLWSYCISIQNQGTKFRKASPSTYVGLNKMPLCANGITVVKLY